MVSNFTRVWVRGPPYRFLLLLILYQDVYRVSSSTHIIAVRQRGKIPLYWLFNLQTSHIHLASSLGSTFPPPPSLSISKRLFLG